MGRAKTLVNVDISQTRCWTCALLSEAKSIDPATGQVIRRYKCPKNLNLPDKLPPNFAEKCTHYQPKHSPGGPSACP